MGATRSPYRNEARSAPLGIKILCVLGALGAIGDIFRGLAALFSSPFGFVVGAIVIAFALAKLVVVWGLWTLQAWAWTLTIAVYGLSLLLDVLRLLTGDFFAIVGIIVGGLLLAYVYSKRHYYR